MLSEDFLSFLLAHKDSVRRHLFIRGIPPADVDDVMQELAIVALQLVVPEDVRSRTSWFWRVVRNQAAIWRRRHKHRLAAKEFQDCEEVFDLDGRIDTVRRLKQLDALPFSNRQRQVFEMRACGYTREEMRKELGVRENTLSMRLRVVRRKVKECQTEKS